MARNLTDEQIKRRILAEKRRKAKQRRMIVMCIVLLLAVADGYFVGRAIGGRDASHKNGSKSRQSAEIISVAEDTPFINTALSQIGNQGGDKFWSWYGFGSHVAWCACYVSWVEDQAGYLSEGIAPKFSLVSDGVSWFSSKDQWLDAGRTPSAGDLIFFDWEQDGVLDHVGIVTAVVDDKVFAVEGNSSDRCRQKRYSLDDFCIAGYGQIKQ